MSPEGRTSLSPGPFSGSVVVLSTLCFLAFWLQNCERIHLCCLQPPSCDAVSWQPLESHAVVLRKRSTVVRGWSEAKVGERGGRLVRGQLWAAESCLVLLEACPVSEWCISERPPRHNGRGFLGERAGLREPADGAPEGCGGGRCREGIKRGSRDAR